MTRWLLLLLLCSACVAPRSLGFGEQVAPLERGQVGLGFSTGVLVVDTTATNAAFSIWGPMAEGSVAVGLSDHLMLDLHGGGAGADVGLRYSTTDKRSTFSVQPQLGLGLLATQSHEAALTLGWRFTQTPNFESVRVAPGVRFAMSDIGGTWFSLLVTNQHLLSLSTASDTGSVEFTGSGGYEFHLGPLILAPELSISYGIGRDVLGWMSLVGLRLGGTTPSKASGEGGRP
jgi:hypothetical protein